ncbi:TetR/AcrR family transcriptional regulator [Falsiroseomonas selenitidurans]|uniref:TetR/AcrR family transcriptional regulator n=1 Tax=Falsiroseomonas selenitidurans TaxID=2716335 RepID=A0ABX1EDG4_9PROT|nr:TetR/AcrR family transcriptional regulator [Falsiroseomonas selenitidurans]NKC33942.1 TetR/AcrR family transcriptional regulator [Falsiroseomonas selenitidurans]
MSRDDTSADLAARRGYHHGNLREALLEAARRLTAERGPHGFTMAEAARLAGVSASAPYRHFKDRDALLAALCRRGFALFGARLGQAAEAGGLTAMGHAYLAFAREEPGYYGAMFDWRSLRREDSGDSFGALVSAIARLLPPAGAGDAAPGRARLLALEVWAISHGVAGLERAGMPPPGPGTPPPEAVLEDAVARILGLRPAPAA